MILRIAIPFKDHAEHVICAVESIPHLPFPVNLVLYDDGSSNTEREKVSKATRHNSSVLLQADERNQGLVRRMRQILSETKHENMLLIAHADVFFYQSAIEAMVKVIQENANVVAVGAKILKTDGLSHQIRDTGGVNENGNIVLRYQGEHKDDPTVNFRERRLYVDGACVLYNMEVLRRHSNIRFDLAFDHPHFVVADFLTLFRLLGYAVIYEPKAEVQHVHNLVGRNDEEEHAKYKQLYMKRWGSFLPYPILQ